MAEWEPDPNGVSQIIELARNAMLPDNYQDTVDRLAEWNKIPDFNMYVCYAFVYCDNEAPDVRMMLAIILKDNVGRYWKTLSPEVQHYIMAHAPELLSHPEMLLRELCGSLLTVILAQTKLTGWPDLLMNLVASLDSENQSLVAGSLATLVMICEDHGRELAQTHPELVQQPLALLIPKLLSLIESRGEDTTNTSLKCLIHLIHWKPAPLLLEIKRFLQILFDLAEKPPSVAVLQTVCSTFNALVFGRVSALMDYMNDVVQYMMLMTGSEHPQVALTASNFWSTIADTDICYKALLPHLPQVVETLLQHMKYSEEELMDMDDVDEDSSTPDRPERALPTAGKINTDGIGQGSYDTSIGTSELTLRKSCGQGLEDLTNVFAEDLLEVVIPLCQVGLESPEWLDREASIMALGACSSVFLYCGTEHLSGIIPMLFALQEDARPLIRYVSSWAISRYSQWIVDQDHMLQPTVESLSRRIRDKSKRVVESSLSALAIISERAAEQMCYYVDDLLPIYMEIYNYLQDRAFVLLLDAIGALCESVGEALNQPHLIDMLMPPLIARWNALDDSDQKLLPLIDCITRIAHGLGMGFSAYAEGVWERPVRLLQNHLMLSAIVKEQPHLDEPDARFAVCSMELLSGILDALKAGAADLVAQSNLVSILVELSSETAPAMLRALLCLIGDLATTCYAHLVPGLEALLPVVISNARPRAFHNSIGVNATWALIEITSRAGDAMGPYADEVCRRAVNILHDDTQHFSFHNNAALLLGRLATFFPAIVCVNLQNFISPWCRVLAQTEENDDKKMAFFGLLAAVKENPQEAMPHFKDFANAVASWTLPSASLKAAFIEIFQAYAQQLEPAVWADLLDTIDPEDMHTLQHDHIL